MATIPSTSAVVSAPTAVARITLGASDTLTYAAGSRQMLILDNTTAGSISVTIDGAGSVPVPIPGAGQTFDTSAGLVIAVPANSMKIVPLDAIRAFLGGVVAVTGGTGLLAGIITT